MGDNSDGHELLSVVAAVHHERVGKALDDRAVGLAESLGGISASRVREVDRGSDLDVVAMKRKSLAFPALPPSLPMYSFVRRGDFRPLLIELSSPFIV